MFHSIQLVGQIFYLLKIANRREISLMKAKGFTTRSLHADRLLNTAKLGTPEHGSMHKPIHTSVAYSYENSSELVETFQGKRPGYAYARQSNPTTDALEFKLLDMEGGGAGCVAFSTGMAAIGALQQALLVPGDHVVATRFLFGNTNSMLLSWERFGIEVSRIDPTQPEELSEAITEKTKLVFVETIANPVTQVADLKRLGEICKKKGVLYVVDSTMTSPFLVQPREYGADIIIHSLTKFIGGHGNAMGGALIDTGLFDWTRFANIQEIYKKGESQGWGVLQIRKKSLRDYGASLSATSAHAISVGIDTLGLRQERSSKNALAIAEYLEKNPKVSKVFYPGLKSHPQHELAMELYGCGGALLSFELEKGWDCLGLLDQLELIASSSNLGDNRSLGIPVAHTIFFEMGPERRKDMGIGDSMIRLSIGIEDTEDLLTDFQEAMDALG
jgi:O-acetylhomoserine (thiol)-lyase